MNLFVRVFLGLAICPLLVSAQNRAQVPWWNSPVASQIGITPGQNQRIKQIVRSYRDRLFDARNEVAKAEAALDELMNDNQMTARSAGPVIERVAQARANSSRIFLDMSTRIREVLTYDQWRQLVERWDEVRGKKLPEGLITPQ